MGIAALAAIAAAPERSRRRRLGFNKGMKIP
jgi:hypothetical protein